MPGADPAAATWQLRPLPAALTLPGSSWIDLEVDGAVVRVPLTGEPARVELGPLPRLPAASEVLVLRVGGTTVTVTSTAPRPISAPLPPGSPPPLRLISVRIAWQIAVARTLHGDGSGHDLRSS